MGDVTLSVAEAESLARACLIANGCNDENADAVAATIAAAERDGCHSHGLFRLPGYCASLRSGKVNGAANPTLQELTPSVLQVDGDGGYAPLSHLRSRDRLIAMARAQGLAAAGLIDVFHFAALWAEVEPLADAGLVAMACTCYTPSVAPAGSAKPLFGTNPIAFAWPRRDAPPVVFDMATATMARGEVAIAARDGHILPPGVGLDAAGAPTTDPNEVLNGVLLPFGGYKGSAIAMMVELLAAGLIGERFSYEAGRADNKDGGPPRGGEFMLAIDPARFGDSTRWASHSDAFFTEMTSHEGVRLPGDRRRSNRARIAAQGVGIPEDLHRKIQDLLNGA